MEANKRVISAYERSEGEIGRPTNDEISSQGEVRFPSNPQWMASGPLSNTQKRSTTPTPSATMAGL